MKSIIYEVVYNKLSLLCCTLNQDDYFLINGYFIAQIIHPIIKNIPYNFKKPYIRYRNILRGNSCLSKIITEYLRAINEPIIMTDWIILFRFECTVKGYAKILLISSQHAKYIGASNHHILKIDFPPSSSPEKTLPVFVVTENTSLLIS